MAATPSPNYSDQQLLAAEPTFINRVRQSLITACNAIKTENPATTAFHRERETFIVAVMNQPDAFKVIFAQIVATNALVIGDATVGGTVPLTSGNVAAQAALSTDVHIDGAISGSINSLFRTPGN